MSIALVTGASTGIGFATALTLARARHTVYASMRNPTTGAGEIRSLAISEKLPLTVISLNVDSDQSVKDAISAVGPIDILVNNAGIADGAAVEELPLDVFRAVMETNFF